MLRILHTADWHLGHSLHGISRDEEHRRFLDWLLSELQTRRVDQLLIAGDVFDTANPPASAQALFYDFLASARQHCPHLGIVVIGGNHDSPARLEAPQPLLARLGVQVFGALPRNAQGAPDFERLILPLQNHAGVVVAWCVAMPFLRPADLPSLIDADADPLIEGVRQVYAAALAAAQARRQPGQALIATGHCYMVGTEISALSERKVLGGNQHALPVDLFPDTVDYVALGHMHRPQKVGEREHVRYSGSPIPMSLSEADYPHQVLLIDFEAGRRVVIEGIRVPRSVDILRLPTEGPLPLKAVLEQLKHLILPVRPEAEWPLLEIRVQLDKPEPGLRQQLDTALADKPLRLVKISISQVGAGQSLADRLPEDSLQGLDPSEVFLRRYRERYDAAPSAELLEAFHELLDQVHAGDAA